MGDFPFSIEWRSRNHSFSTSMFLNSDHRVLRIQKRWAIRSRTSRPRSCLLPSNTAEMYSKSSGSHPKRWTTSWSLSRQESINSRTNRIGPVTLPVVSPMSPGAGRTRSSDALGVLLSISSSLLDRVRSSTCPPATTESGRNSSLRIHSTDAGSRSLSIRSRPFSPNVQFLEHLTGKIGKIARVSSPRGCVQRRIHA